MVFIGTSNNIAVLNYMERRQMEAGGKMSTGTVTIIIKIAGV